MLQAYWEKLKNKFFEDITFTAYGTKVREGIVGIEIYDTGVAVAFLKRQNNQYLLKLCDFITAFDMNERQTAIKNFVEINNLNDCLTAVNLLNFDYHVIQLESPNVPQDEVFSALGWQVQDFIEFPIEESLYDYIELPPDLYKGRQKLLVCAAKKEDVQAIASLIGNSGLTLSVVEAPETACQNIINVISEDTAADMAILRIVEGACYITIYHDKQLGLCREVELTAENPDDVTESTEHNLIREIQRTFRYYTVEAKQENPSSVYIIPSQPEWELVEESVLSQLEQSISLLNWRQVLKIDSDVELKTLRQCSGAICAALRTIVKEDYEAAT